MPDQPPAANRSLSEEEVVRLIQSLTGDGDGELLVGIGDDAAVLAVPATSLVVTTDLLVEGVHFDLSFISPYDLGGRAMAANLSDLAGMGAAPRWGFLSLGLPPQPRAGFIEELVRGLVDLGRSHGLTLAGGDTVRSPQVVINLCLIGQAGSAQPALRSGARAGDAVCVTGSLGGSGAGLAWLQTGGDPQAAEAREAVEAHLRPLPRVATGRALTETGQVHAMMDLSDGLATDLYRLAQASGLGARVQAEALPIAESTRHLAQKLGADSTNWALRGGEDFELLFTCDPGQVELLAESAAKAEPGLKVSRVGSMTPEPGIWLEGEGPPQDIGLSGYDHFREGG